MEFIFNVDTAEAVAVATEDLNEVVLFEFDEGVCARCGVDEVFTNSLEVCNADSCCFALFYLFVVCCVEKVV